jgi:hypothetical protein
MTCKKPASGIEQRVLRRGFRNEVPTTRIEGALLNLMEEYAENAWNSVGNDIRV